VPQAGIDDRLCLTGRARYADFAMSLQCLAILGFNAREMARFELTRQHAITGTR
jgi:hypothetical protein